MIGGNDELDATARLADFAALTRFTDLPQTVVTRLTQCLLDLIGVIALGSAHAESAPAILASVEKLAGSAGSATVIGSRRRYPEQYAAMLNGGLAHSLEFDDTNTASAIHPGAAVTPAALALAEQQNASSQQLLSALAVGYEVSCRVGTALGAGASSRGFHTTGPAGLFGATAAGGQLLGFTRDQLISAFGLAGSMAAASRQYKANGSWNKQLHPGLAAHNAVLALTFASSGIRGAEQALEGRFGLLVGYSAEPNPTALTDQLGQQWSLLQTGIKPYPSSQLSHGAIDAALQLRNKVDRDILTTSRYALQLSPAAYTSIGERRPSTIAPANTVDAQTSVYFQIAVALLDGVLDWTSYRRRGDRDIEHLSHRINVTPDDRVTTSGAVLTCLPPTGMATQVRVDQPAGSPQTHIPWQFVERKFNNSARALFSDQQRTDIREYLRELPERRSIRSLTQLLRPASPAEEPGIHEADTA
jgi:2-methylcitrate dehydratase PrpD